MKLIFLDVDGTLIPFGTYMPTASAVEAIKLARKNGHKVFLNTGRCRCEIHKELEEIGFDGIICSNSLYIEENNKILFQKNIPAERVKALADWLSDNKVGFFFEGHKSVMATPLYFEQMIERFGEKAVNRLKKGFPSIKESDLSYDDVAKINFITRHGLAQKIKQEFSKDFQINEWSLLGDDAGMGEITLHEASKAEGVRVIIEHLGAKKEDTYAFGDTSGDLPMIKYCGTGVAMGNAEQVLKDEADYVTSDVDKDGIINAFRHFEFI